MAIWLLILHLVILLIAVEERSCSNPRQYVVDSFAGGGPSELNPGPATASSISSVYNIWLTSSNVLYLCANNEVRAIDSSGIISLYAGGGSGSGTIKATSVLLSFAIGVWSDTLNTVYVSEYSGQYIRKIDTTTGILYNVAGCGAQDSFGDGGAATSAAFDSPFMIGGDTVGNIYIADSGNHKIRLVSSGTISTFLGKGVSGSTGDGGPLSSASIAFPQGVMLDSTGNIFVSERSGNYVRKVISTSTLSTVAGTGVPTFNGDGLAATNTAIHAPRAIFSDSTGVLYIADVDNYRVRMIYSSIGYTIAGS